MLANQHGMEIEMFRHALTLAALMTIATSAAQAHVGIGDTNGFAHGFGHPIGGIDHVLVMVAVGLFASHLGGHALWAVPLSFVAMMIVGGVLGMGGVTMPLVEVGIGISVVVLGVAIAFGCRMPTAAAMAMVGVFAVFHGHAHGAEMLRTASGLSYGIGFTLATAFLHVCGIGVGLEIGRVGEAYGGRILRVAGSAMAVAGIAILTGYL
jgi:urease accessory protein